MNQGKTKNVFVSHHHKDDEHVDKLTGLLKGKGYSIRNSSIRAKPANQRRLEQGLVSDETIRRLLRMKISWAGTVVVLIGQDTHSRPWVDWETRQAKEQGKNIVGVYERGLKDNVQLPASLEKYATSIVGWNSEKIIRAIEGLPAFENPDGSPSPRRDGAHQEC